MRSISQWGKLHPWKTRFLIIALYFPLNFLGITLGAFFHEQGSLIPESVIYLAAVLIFCTAVVYPSKSRRSFFSAYARRKTLDAILLTSTFLIITTGANRLCRFESIPALSFYTLQQVRATESVVSWENNDNNLKKIKQQSKRQGFVKKYLQAVKRFYQSRSNGEKVILMILTVLIATFLVLLLSGLACSIACGGSEGLAFLVFIIGLGGIVLGVVKIFQMLIKKYPPKSSTA